MVASLVAFAVVGLALVAFGARLGRKAFLVAALPAIGSTVWIATRIGSITEGRQLTERATWVGPLDLAVDLRLDGLAATMALIISAVGVGILFYASRYFAPDARDLGRLAGLLALFGGAMLGLVLADNILVLYTCWELTSITSFLLIGNRHTESRARAAALHALLVTAAGGLALLGGLVLLGQKAGSFRLSDIAAHPPAVDAATTVAVGLLLIGAFTKSAQYPFHAWLPGAMAAATPVSAYLHSATMVKAGVFLDARLAPVFAGSTVWRPVVLAVGCITLVFGGLRALRQHDLKLLLAFGTVSQLGLLMVLFGAGTATAATAGWVLLVAHAAFKATLFMVVGIIDHQTGTRDIRKLPPLRDGWRPTEVVAVLAAVSMAGVPLGGGFVAKELAYEALAEAPFSGAGVVLAAVVAGSMLTVAYAIRFVHGAFIAPRRRADAADPAVTDPTVTGKAGAGAAAGAGQASPGTDAPVTPPPPGIGFLAPAAVLAAVGVVLGVAPGIADRIVTVARSGYGDGPVHLALWHGLNLPLALSALTLAGGAALFLADHWVQGQLALGRIIPSGSEAYVAFLRALGIVSARVTGVVQNGSLPVYTGVILATISSAVAVSLAVGQSWPGWPEFGHLREAPVVGILLTAALGAAVVRRRFSAAVFLGVAGYAMAGIFVLSGAPDLALTQAAVETLTTVVFVLVLRRLPERFERQSSPARRVVRVAVATAVGASVFVFALVAAGYRLPPTVSDEMVARSLPDGHGRNVVNVILVDFRGLDTMGEITVLAAAAIGAVALARAGRRPGGAPGTPGMPGVRRLPFVRLPFIDVSVRVIFHVVLMTSLWLLFAGHNQPGGGFVGGLLAGSAITLRYIAGGIDEVRALSRFRPWTVLGAGVLLATVTAALPLGGGGDVLEGGLFDVDLPGIGDLKVSSALAFDAGVYLAVVGMVLMVFEAFGDRPQEAA